MFTDHDTMVYGGIRNFLYKNGLNKHVCNVIRFRGNKKYPKHVYGDDIQDALSPSTAIFWFISDETIYQNKSWCLILDVDGCFIYFLHEIVYRHFSYFQYGFQIDRQRSRDYFLLLVQIKVLYISNILWKFHSDRLNGSGDTLCWTHMLSIFRSPWNMLGTEVLVFWGAWQLKC